MQYKIMIVEDDYNMASLLSEHLRKFGYIVYCCQNFSNILDEFNLEKPHMVLLDITLPAYDGFYWCNKLRLKSAIPIVFLSSRNTESDQVHAMMNGADDYISKPFSFEVVTAKVGAVLRRAYGEYASNDLNELQCMDCIFLKKQLLLTRLNHKVELSKTEAGVIRILFQNYPNIVTREELLEEIWDNESFVEENTLNVTISRIRKKLEIIHSETIIKPIRGIGYRIGGADEIY